VAPIIPPLVILATLGLHQLNHLLADRKKNLPAWIASGTVLVLMGNSLALNAAYVLQQFCYVDPLSYISGRMSRDAYISKYRPEHSVYLYANHNLPNNAKILGLFLGKRLYYSEREIVFGINEFKRIVDQAESDQAILESLKQNGFTFLIIRFDLFNRWTNSQFDDRKKLIVKFFFDERVEHILSEDGYGLFQLKDDDNL
jgi:hypothetical protein